MLTLTDGTTQRLCFGQNKKHDFETAMEKAKQFVSVIGCPWSEETEDPKYTSVINKINGRVITKIRLTTASKLIAIYITTSGMDSYKDQIRVCFGGKTISHEEAYLTAMDFIQSLNISDTTEVQDQIHQSSQQVTAS
jgi:hypothetical protein